MQLPSSERLSIAQEHTFLNFESRLLYREALKGIITESIRLRKG